MILTTEKTNDANATATGLLEKAILDSKYEKLSTKAAKTLKVDGFRKGKVPPHIIRSRFGEQLNEDAEKEALGDFVQEAIKVLELDQQQLIGSPMVLKFDRNDDGVSVELRFASRPKIDFQNIQKAIPDFEIPSTEDKEVQERIHQITKSYGSLEEVSRAVENGDITIIDFEGFVDNEPFEGGKAERYSLEIGSGSFISGFEDQIIGMNIGEEKDIHVTFPENYGAANLAGKPAIFKIKLHKIQQKQPAELNEELIKKVLPALENPTEEMFREKIKEQLDQEHKMKLYDEKLKSELVDNLLEKIDFNLPLNVVEQEMDVLFRNELNRLPEQEIQDLQGQVEKVQEKREAHREDAQKSVKLTFIVDTLAKENNIGVTDQEIWQRIYFEAMSYRQDPKVILEYYQKNGLLPALQMALLEEKVLTHLLDESKK
ncbi:trigger factor [Helicobacter monodelphidis]|uniref:trigger factor n=1 Tax=Helicobacter sp. 15-1451 TaxID=2004995 RepID=UPI000DCD6856|nr:trigger factor [Helicobacter sp. 15-1451]RAX57011.1 trigger factor [Helicobacter sp. 15-1451]